MNPLSMTGAFLVTLALLSYGIGSITLQRFKLISSPVLWFLSIGVLLDIAATTFMILGSSNTPFTLHGFIGYSALLTMIVDLALVWQVRQKYGVDTFARKKLLLFSKVAYGWWIVAYITGSLLVLWK